MDDLKCSNCGAPVKSGELQCKYCKTETKSKIQKNNQSLKWRYYPLNVKEKIIFSSKLIITALLSSLSWFAECPGSFWCSDKAVIIWVGLVPVWCFLSGRFFKFITSIFIDGVGYFLSAALPFFIGVAIKKRGINDDALGLSSLIGGAAMAGFFLGILWRKFHFFKLKKSI